MPAALTPCRGRLEVSHLQGWKPLRASFEYLQTLFVGECLRRRRLSQHLPGSECLFIRYIAVRLWNTPVLR